jgi:alpha-amylase
MASDLREEAASRASLEELRDLYLDKGLDKMILRRVCRKCYAPANQTILDSIERHEGQEKEVKAVFSISWTLVEQLERWAPEVLDSFRKLAQSRCVELLDQTYYHSLSSLYPPEKDEFVDQIRLHRELMKDVFGVIPRVFENTEFIFNNSIAGVLAGMGYRGVFTEGATRVLNGRSPNQLYDAEGGDITVLLRNHTLSDDIAFRFSAANWPGSPLTAEKFASWLASSPGDCVNIFVDYETFGEHQWPETGILEFLRWLPDKALAHDGLSFRTASEMIESHPPAGKINVDDFNTISWADQERSTNAWLGNDMQRTSFRALKGIEPFARQTGDQEIMSLWRYLQTSDHLYYMYTRPDAAGEVHGYFSSQPPVKAFWIFSRILSNLQGRVADHLDGPASTSARLLRILPPGEAFHFQEDGRYIRLSAHSLQEFREALSLATHGSLAFHSARGDFEGWVRTSVGDAALADDLASLDGNGGPTLRQTLLDLLDRRLQHLGSWRSHK